MIEAGAAGTRTRGVSEEPSESRGMAWETVQSTAERSSPTMAAAEATTGDLPVPRVRLEPRGSALGRRLLIAAVVGYFALLILVPAGALIRGAFEGGLGAFAAALSAADAWRAFGLTLGITVLATLVNTVFGLALAIVLVRQKFRGRTLADGLVCLPFAVSPIIAGLMLVVLYGPHGWIGRWLEPLGLRVVYQWPGMLLATTFVTLPFVVREVVPVLREFGV